MLIRSSAHNNNTSSSASGLLSNIVGYDWGGRTWPAALFATIVVFVVGSPVLLSGLSYSGYLAAFFLGLITWKSFGPPGFIVVSSYFVIGTLATKLKIKEKEKSGIAEKRGGKRGPESVVGSSAAAVFCAILASLPLSYFHAPHVQELLQLGFVANFCTKLSDTTASEIGKAFGKTTYLVTNFKQVPRGTEGAISLEGTLAGLAAAIFLAFLGYFTGQVNEVGAFICILASQVANFGESFIGAEFQDKPGFEWMTNDVVNVLNISAGAALAIVVGSLL